MRLEARTRALTLCALAFLSSAGALTGPFLGWDDDMYITRNPRVQDSTLTGLLTLWSPAASLRGEFIEYSPLRDTVYWALWAVGSGSAVWFHAASLVLHAAVTLLVWRVGARLGLDARAATLAAALFAVHPVHVESVAWIATLKDPLYSIFFLLGFERALSFSAHGRMRDLALTLACCVLGAASKAQIVVLPACVLLVDLMIRRTPLRQAAIAALPSFLLVATLLPFMVSVARANDVISAYPGGTFATGAMTSIVSVALYAAKLLVPVGLSALYVVEEVVTPTDWRLVVAVTLVALTFGATLIQLGRRNPWPLCAVLWYVGCLVPVLNFVPHHIEVADRYQYVASIAPLWAVSVWLSSRYAFGGLWRIMPVSMCVTFVTLSFLQSRRWADEVLLWQQVVETEGERTRAQGWVAYGDALRRAERLDEALEAYRRAAARPESRTLARPDSRLALVHVDRGELDLALLHAVRATERAPTAQDGWLALARVARARGDVQGAAWATERISSLQVTNPAAHWNAGVALAQASEGARAAVAFARAVELDAALCERLAQFVAYLGSEAHADTARRVAPALRSCPGRG